MIVEVDLWGWIIELIEAINRRKPSQGIRIPRTVKDIVILPVPSFDGNNRCGIGHPRSIKDFDSEPEFQSDERFGFCNADKPADWESVPARWIQVVIGSGRSLPWMPLGPVRLVEDKKPLEPTTTGCARVFLVGYGAINRSSALYESREAARA